MPSESQQVREEVNGLKHILRERQADLAGRDVLDTVQGTFQSIRTQEGRALSFASGWPHSHYVCLQVRDLSAAGFFFTPTTTCADRVTCAYCGLELGGWTTDKNIAWEAHGTGNPACPFLSGLVSDIDADPDAPSRRASGKRTTEAPVLKDCVWFVHQYVDFPGETAPPVLVTNESVSNDVRIDGCEGSSKRRPVTVEIKGAPPNGEAVRSLFVADSSYVRVLADRVVLKVVVVNCKYVEVVLGGHPPHISVKNTTGCTFSLCPEDMDHVLETSNSTGVAVQAVSRLHMPTQDGPVRPEGLLRALDKNLHETVIIPEKMVTKVAGEVMETAVSA